MNEPANLKPTKLMDKTNYTPSDILWMPDENLPEKVLKIFPPDSAVETILQTIFPDGIPEGMGKADAIGYINARRKKIYQNYLEGVYDHNPSLLERDA
jgi:hypothetical protein